MDGKVEVSCVLARTLRCECKAHTVHTRVSAQAAAASAEPPAFSTQQAAVVKCQPHLVCKPHTYLLDCIHSIQRQLPFARVRVAPGLAGGHGWRPAGAPFRGRRTCRCARTTWPLFATVNNHKSTTQSIRPSYQPQSAFIYIAPASPGIHRL